MYRSRGYEHCPRYRSRSGEVQHGYSSPPNPSRLLLSPDVMRQLADRYDAFKESLPLLDELGLQMAIENHTDTFADEVLWVINQLKHPKVGACVDTMNPLQVMENPQEALDKMLPQAICCHFSDDVIIVDPLGVHDVGAPHGKGSMDLVGIVQQIRDKSPMDRIILENEIAFKSLNEPIEKARERELQACEESIDYLRNVLKLVHAEDNYDINGGIMIQPSDIPQENASLCNVRVYHGSL